MGDGSRRRGGVLGAARAAISVSDDINGSPPVPGGKPGVWEVDDRISAAAIVSRAMSLEDDEAFAELIEVVYPMPARLEEVAAVVGPMRSIWADAVRRYLTSEGGDALAGLVPLIEHVRVTMRKSGIDLRDEVVNDMLKGEDAWSAGAIDCVRQFAS
jgi:phosphoenolpyruvate carboxylase